ncbi:MAG: pilus assembly protein PilM [Acidimicrobiia bacterium]
MTRALGRSDRAVGLDITDDSVRGVEVEKGLIRSRAEVAFPAGSVVDGTIVDQAAVVRSLKQLWRTGRFHTHTAVFGAPIEHVVARQLDLPDLHPGELRSALRFEVDGVIPFSLDECVMDCAEIEREQLGDEPAVTRVLVVAVYLPPLRAWLDALRSARIEVTAVDHWAAGLVRAAGPSPRSAGSDELLVDIGEDTLSVCVQRDGVIRFARSLTGFATASSVASELEAELDRIERYRLRASAGGTAVLPETRAQRDPIADVVRSTIDYLAFQPGKVEVASVRLGGQLDRARTVLGSLVSMLGVPVSIVPPLLEDAAGQRRGLDLHRGRDLLALGHGLAARSDSFGPPPLDLLPTADRLAPQQRRARMIAVGSIGVAAAGLAAATALASPDVDGATTEQARAEALLSTTRAKLAQSASTSPDAVDLSNLSATIAVTSANSVDWKPLLDAIVGAAPPDSPLVAFAGTAGKPGNGGGDGLGTVQISVQGSGTAASSSWLEALGKVKLLSAPWPGATTSASGGLTPGSLATTEISATISRTAARTATVPATTAMVDPAAATADGGVTPAEDSASTSVAPILDGPGSVVVPAPTGSTPGPTEGSPS